MNLPQPESEELLQYFWPHPFPSSHPPIEVIFSNGIPESEHDPIHKVFIMTYAGFKVCLEAIVARQVAEARKAAYADCGSKGGTGTVVRLYAKSRANEIFKDKP